jgi:hypothetical protein
MDKSAPLGLDKSISLISSVPPKPENFLQGEYTVFGVGFWRGRAEIFWFWRGTFLFLWFWRGTFFNFWSLVQFFGCKNEQIFYFDSLLHVQLHKLLHFNLHEQLFSVGPSPGR